jgi:hypothetical protein
MLHQDLPALLTPERLRSYTPRCPDLTSAIRLYEWNMRAAAAVLGLTGIVEVIARNSLDRELGVWAARRGAPTWFDAVHLDQQGRLDLDKARARASRNGRRPEIHGRVKREVRARMQQLHFVRNRAAHHEPIHQRDLRRDLDAALELLGWIHPVAAEWAADTTSLRAVLDARPSD